MVPAQMIKDFADEIKMALTEAGFMLPDETGKLQLSNVYAHALPPPKRDDPAKVPWVLVYLHTGAQSSASEPRVVTVHITCMTYDDKDNMQGYIDAMNLLELICQYLYGKTIIAKRYSVTYPYQFAVLDDAKFPYFSAGLSISVKLPGTTPQNQIGGYAYV